MKKTGAFIEVNGIVQGVGFRPFIHKQITDHSLCGWIRNTAFGAEIEIEGTEERIDLFIKELWTKKPKLALIETVNYEKYTELKNFTDFKIIESKSNDFHNTLISPDVCICDDCIREMFEPKDRRFRYPFINCTNCGPRFTIIKDIPYDRNKTTMAPFAMCNDCKREYTDIYDRRYHAQPVACDECGPQVEFIDERGKSFNKDDAIKKAQEYLKSRKIITVKGLGGMHLACDANDEELVKELRSRKHRDEKPFALMARDMEAVKEICNVSEEEEKILTNFRRPIVLLEKKNYSSFMHISENNYIGVMLPYTPVHYLIFEDCPPLLVMTSANISDFPIIYKNEEALERLENVADGFLLNNREIETSCDDSLCRVFEGKEYFMRRSRGYVPFPVKLKEEYKNTEIKRPVLACGAEQKATFALSKNNYVFLSQHIGDLKNIETLDNYESQIEHFKRMFGIKPAAVVCDLHPDYLSSAYAKNVSEKEGIPLIRLQHHHAHMTSCMADNDLNEKVIGIIWDGTGLGTDGTIWGGEFLTGDYKGFERQASIMPFKLPGGDKCTKEIYRSAVSLLDISGVKTTDEKFESAKKMLEADINSPVCTSMGRLFDGAAWMMGIKDEATYEGQAALLLEAEAVRFKESILKNKKNDAQKEVLNNKYDYDIINSGIMIFDFTKMIRQIWDEKKTQEPGYQALKFLNTLCHMSVEITKQIRIKTKINKVVLSGGTFQNQYLLEKLNCDLKSVGFDVFCHKRVSPNDEGLALGQVAAAMRGL